MLYAGRDIKLWFAKAFLKDLGFSIRRHSKALYYDGHERPDVRVRRTRFLKEMKRFERRMTTYSGRNCEIATPPMLSAGERELVLVVHDESTFHTNDDDPYMYVEEGRSNCLKRKDQGGGINVSAFLSEKCGVVRLTDAELNQLRQRHPDINIAQDSTVKMKIGTKYSTANTGDTLLGLEHSGWWNNELVLAQIKKMIPIFEAQHPGCQGLFIFDNSTGHNAYATDALLARNMNSNPGGKQPCMRNTVWRGKVQRLVFGDGDILLFDYQGQKAGTKITVDNELYGLAKGSKQVCLERDLPIHAGRTQSGKQKYLRHCCKPIKKTADELFEDEMKRAQGRAHEIETKIKHTGSRAAPCCCVHALSLCEDFKNQKNSVEEAIEDAGHRCCFLPKFHPELNYIERFWGHVKRWLRSHCLYTMAGLWDNLDRAFSEDITPLLLQRKFARKSWRWMSVYRKGLSPQLSAFAARKYHGHRSVPATMDQLVEELERLGQKTDSKKLVELIGRDEKLRVEGPLTLDPTKMNPDVFVGLRISKEFEGMGEYEGTVMGHDVDMLGNKLFKVEYLDGDEEDLFLSELVLNLVDKSILVNRV